MTQDVRLGKLAPRYDERTLKLARYIDLGALPTPPPATNRAETVRPSFQMFANDRLGDCTCAGMGNYEEFWAALTGAPCAITTDEVVAAYRAITGYDPETGENDNGAVELDVLKYWRQTGLAGHKIEAFAALNLGDQQLVQTAIWLFDGAYLGVALPITAQSQEVWDYTPQAGSQAYPGSWGGHCVVAVDYNATGPIVATWGQLKQMTWAFWVNYVDEAYAIIALEEFAAGGKTAEGFDHSALAADLTSVTA